MVGDLTSVAAEVLVCSIANGDQQLDQCGAVAVAFAKKGGTVLQDAFKQIGGVAEGKVYTVSTTGNISCKSILFLGVRDWNGQSTKQVLGSVRKIFTHKPKHACFQSLILKILEIDTDTETL